MTLFEYLNETIQNKHITNISITLGKQLDSNIFNRNVKLNYSSIYDKLLNNQRSIKINKYFVYNNYKVVKNTDTEYFKEYELDSKIFNKTNLDLFVRLTNSKKISQIEFPNQLEYNAEYVENEISIRYSDFINVLLIDNKYIIIQIEKNAYIDNTLDELKSLLTLLNIY